MNRTPLKDLEALRIQSEGDHFGEPDRLCPTVDAGFRLAVNDVAREPGSVRDKRRKETLRLAAVTLIASIAALTLLAAFTLIVGIVVHPIDTLLRSPAGPSAG